MLVGELADGGHFTLEFVEGKCDGRVVDKLWESRGDGNVRGILGNGVDDGLGHDGLGLGLAVGVEVVGEEWNLNGWALRAGRIFRNVGEVQVRSGANVASAKGMRAGTGQFVSKCTFMSQLSEDTHAGVTGALGTKTLEKALVELGASALGARYPRPSFEPTWRDSVPKAIERPAMAVEWMLRFDWTPIDRARVLMARRLGVLMMVLLELSFGGTSL